MSPATHTPDIFDQWAGAARFEQNMPPTLDGQSQAAMDSDSAQPNNPPTEASPTPPLATPASLRRAVQELLRQGLLERTLKKPQFQQVATDTARVNALLEPLDLEVRVDDARGLAFVAVAASYQPEDSEDDEWTHPLVRRQRLTLEQSLLLAMLRREFLQREQEHGLGVPVQLALDGLLPQLEIYLGHTGSDMQERKRLLNLLDNLHDHGVVSKVDAQDNFTIRPMIVHLANPENLQALLQRLRELSGHSPAAAEQSA
jgi:Domain of unknown function (DUF4194)